MRSKLSSTNARCFRALSYVLRELKSGGDYLLRVKPAFNWSRSYRPLIIAAQQVSSINASEISPTTRTLRIRPGLLPDDLVRLPS